jgi:tetratricopeptide (TPR) repeat protein
VSVRWGHAREALKQAEELLKTHQREQAAVLLDQVLPDRFNDAHAQFLAARLDRQLGNLTRAEQRLSRCRELWQGPREELALEFVLLRVQQGDLNETETPRDYTDRETPQAPLVLEALARGYMIRGRLVQAQANLDRWIALEPDNPHAWLALGELYVLQGRPNDAQAEIRKALDLSPDSPKANRALGLTLLSLNTPRRAIPFLKKALRLDPGNRKAQVGLAACYRLASHCPEARNLAETVLAEEPDNLFALLELGQIAVEEQSLDEACTLFRRVLAHDSQSRLAHYNLARLLRRQGNTAEAAEHETQVKLLEKAEARYRDMLQKTLPRNPRDPNVHYEAGTTLLVLGRRQQAVAAFQAALELAPHHVPSLKALVHYYAEQGEKEPEDGYRQLLDEVTAGLSDSP